MCYINHTRSPHQTIRTKYGLLQLELIYDKMYGTQKDVDKTTVQIYAYEISYPWLLEEYYNEENFD